MLRAVYPSHMPPCSNTLRPAPTNAAVWAFLLDTYNMDSAERKEYGAELPRALACGFDERDDVVEGALQRGYVSPKGEVLRSKEELRKLVNRCGGWIDGLSSPWFDGCEGMHVQR